MKPNQQKSKRRSGKLSMRLRPREGKNRNRSLTADQARQRAARYVANKMFKGTTVRDGGETWVVYKESPLTRLGPSEIVVVCKRTGKVLYEGEAHDEG